MHDITEANEIYKSQKTKNPNFDTLLVSNWKEQMPEEFIRKMLKIKYGCHIVDREMYDKAVQLLGWAEDKGQGAKWSVEDIKSASNIDFNTKDYTLLDFAYVMNMLYSDYCNIFTDTGYYVKMAKSYLEDPDYMGDPSERAYHNALKRINYFKD